MRFWTFATLIAICAIGWGALRLVQPFPGLVNSIPFAPWIFLATGTALLGIGVWGLVLERKMAGR